MANEAMLCFGDFLYVLQMHPVLSNKTLRRMRTKFLMFSIICLLVEIQ